MRQKEQGQVEPLKVAALFAGIGGIERGLHTSGHSTELLCEIDETAQRVLGTRFPGVPLVGDVRKLKSLPKVDLVAAGFPCQDLSQAGQTAGIAGGQSGLVGEVFRLVGRSRGPRWLLLENVSFMLQLDRGRAMSHLIESLEELKFRWAYRVVDAQGFGLPQRRHRVLFLASRKEDPRSVLLASDWGQPPKVRSAAEAANGFFWTEGVRGLGWAVDAIPTLKGGSSVGIPSPPAIWMPDGRIVTPDVRDAERLQGFPADWTTPAVTTRKGVRWKLIGNAVNVEVARWLGARLRNPSEYEEWADPLIESGSPWPKAAWGGDGKVHASQASLWPSRKTYKHLEGFLRYPSPLLSERAASGFLSRASRSSLHFPDGMLDQLRTQLADQGS
jgi:DNA (cytosine-5)-methyltransferase 1